MPTDGSRIPSFLGSSCTTYNDVGSMGFGNTTLRAGEVQKIIYPDDDENISKVFLEYRVSVGERDGSTPGASRIYGNCYVANLFGGVADTFTYTLRPSSQKNVDAYGIGLGSKVLILCINGEYGQAVILGGVRMGSGSDGLTVNIPDKKENGHNLQFEFNGLSASINKDGELTITFSGATDAAGTYAEGVDKNNDGSTVQFTKDGSVSMGHDSESVVANWGNHRVELAASSNITLKSKGVLTGDATDFTILGETYRHSEDSMLQGILEALDKASAAMVLSAQALNVAATALTANTPIVAGPAVATAAQALTSAATPLAQASGAISGFLLDAESYLSKKNKSD